MMDNEELWLPVVGYEGLYEVSDQGRVCSVARTVQQGGRTYRVKERILKAGPNTVGYPQVSLSKDGYVERGMLVHWLVLQAFIGPAPEGQEGLHWDDVPHNNHLSNLRYGTKLENAADKTRNAKMGS